ncbi:MAG TPA: hypothetical protein VF955_06560 [Pyrinomonadaceae bacterium]
MEAEITDAATSSELPLAEPHFDDEATLLSARRVVPLDEVLPYGSQATSRFARGWMFAATVVGALLLGVAASVAYYSYLNREPAQLFVDTETIVGGVEGVSTEPPQASANVSQVNNTRPPDSNPGVTRQEEPVSPSPSVSSNEAKRPVARRVDVLTSPSSPDEAQAREERKARREVKKRIRELERESRNPKSRNDLSRIREIFEGPQKP